MIGVIPAAGEGSNMGVKSLVKVGGRRLIEHPLRTLQKIGIRKAVIVEHGDSGWEPEISNFEGVSRLVRWIKEYRELFG